MSDAWGPRRVEHGAIKRWTREAAGLIGRSPMPFGALIVVICGASWGVSDWFASEIQPIATLAYLTGPAVLVFGLGAARHADHGTPIPSLIPIVHQRRIQLLFQLMGLLIAVTLITLLEVTFESQHSPSLGWTAQDIWLGFWMALIACDGLGIALIMFGPQMPTLVIVEQVRQGLEKNGASRLQLMVIGLLPFTLVSAVPSAGMIQAVAMVFVSVFVYVAYRDIFEGQPTNRARSTKQQHADSALPCPQTGQ